MGFKGLGESSSRILPHNPAKFTCICRLPKKVLCQTPMTGNFESKRMMTNTGDEAKLERKNLQRSLIEILRSINHGLRSSEDNVEQPVFRTLRNPA